MLEFDDKNKGGRGEHDKKGNILKNKYQIDKMHFNYIEKSMNF